MTAAPPSARAMQRGRTERETCELNGWGIGTFLRGHEQWGDGGAGTWTTMRITGFGESIMLGRCVKHERTQDSEIVQTEVCGRHHWESTWTLSQREWIEVPA